MTISDTGVFLAPMLFWSNNVQLFKYLRGLSINSRGTFWVIYQHNPELCFCCATCAPWRLGTLRDCHVSGISKDLIIFCLSIEICWSSLNASLWAENVPQKWPWFGRFWVLEMDRDFSKMRHALKKNISVSYPQSGVVTYKKGSRESPILAPSRPRQKSELKN